MSGPSQVFDFFISIQIVAVHAFATVLFVKSIIFFELPGNFMTFIFTGTFKVFLVVLTSITAYFCSLFKLYHVYNKF